MSHSILRLLLGMIHDLKMGDNQATITDLRSHPRDQRIKGRQASRLGSEHKALDSARQGG